MRVVCEGDCAFYWKVEEIKKKGERERLVVCKLKKKSINERRYTLIKELARASNVSIA